MKYILLSLLFLCSCKGKESQKEWTMVHCYGSASERDQQMVQTLTSILSGGMEVSGWATIDRNGLYCWEIYMPVQP